MMRCKVKMRGVDEAVKGRREEREEVKRLAPFADLPGEVWRVLGLPYGGPYMGRDADGEAFYPETQIWLNPGDERPVTYYHGFGPDDPYAMQEVPAVIGTAKYAGSDAAGHWFEVKFDPAEALAGRVLGAIAVGTPVRASSGAAGHLVREGQAGLLDVWPVAELAIFDINEWRMPANPLAALENPNETAGEIPEAVDTGEIDLEEGILESIPPEMAMAKAGEAPAMERNGGTGSEQEAVKAATISDSEPGGPAGDETMEQQDIQALAEALKPMIAQTVQAEIEKQNEPTGIGGMLAAKSAAAVKKVSELGFAHDEMKSFLHWAKTGDEAAYKAAMVGQTDANGGYTVPDDFYNQVVAKRNLMSWIRKMPGINPIQTSLDRVLVPAENVAATKMVVTSETSAYDENEPTFSQVAITIHKWTKLMKVSEELLADNKVNLEGYLATAFARALAIGENYYFTKGTGSGEPQGVLTGATSAFSAAGAAALTAAELSKLKYTMGAGYEDSVSTGWLMQNATWGYIGGLTGNFFQFRSTPQGDVETMFGRPVGISDDMEALATGKKSVLYGNFGFYGVAERSGLVVSRNPWLYQANGYVGFFASVRQGGAVLQAEAFQYITQA